MKKIILLILIAFTVISCSDESATNNNESDNSISRGTYSECDPIEVDIMAGQSIYAGSISVENDLTNLYVTYTTTTNWFLKEVHLYVGTYAGIPSKNGNPTPGKFPYKASFSASKSTHTFTIPLSNIVRDANGCMYIAAHSSLKKVVNGTTVQTETGWAGDLDFPGANWATYFQYCTRTCEPELEATCETAFMFGNTTFNSLQIGQRWGWANQFTNVADGTYTFNLYTGAGQNNLNNGFLIGTVSVTVAGTNVNVTYNLTSDGYVITSTHVYLSDAIPTTTAPGLYGNQHTLNSTSDSYNLTYSGDGSFWLVAHAVVCENEQ